MTSMRERAGQCLAMRRALGYRLECQGRLLPDFTWAATISDRIIVPGAPAASGGASAAWTRPQAHSAAC
jgi:hypothetical protein